MGSQETPERKRPQRANISSEDKLLVGRIEAAEMLSISARALDYLVANNQLTTRRIGTRVLIPTSELRRFSPVIIQSGSLVDRWVIVPRGPG